MWDSEGVPCCSPHDSEAGVGVGMEVASILATFLTDVQHRSKMVTNYGLRLTAYRLPLTAYGSPTTADRSPLTDYRSPLSGPRFAYTISQLLLIKYWVLHVGLRRSPMLQPPRQRSWCGGGYGGSLNFGDIFDRCATSLKNGDKILLIYLANAS